MIDLPIKLIGSNIAVQFEVVEEAKGLIIIPEKARNREAAWAQVIAVGTGRRTKKDVLVPFEVKVGDRVLVAPQHKTLKQSWILADALFGRSDIVIIKEEDIIVVDDE